MCSYSETLIKKNPARAPNENAIPHCRRCGTQRWQKKKKIITQPPHVDNAKFPKYALHARCVFARYASPTLAAVISLRNTIFAPTSSARARSFSENFGAALSLAARRQIGIPNDEYRVNDCHTAAVPAFASASARARVCRWLANDARVTLMPIIISAEREWNREKRGIARSCLPMDIKT